MQTLITTRLAGHYAGEYATTTTTTAAAAAVALLVFSILSCPSSASSDQLPISTILPKLEAIHEDSKALLIKNTELRRNILAGLQSQLEAKLKKVQSGRLSVDSSAEAQNQAQKPKQAQNRPTGTDKKPTLAAQIDKIQTNSHNQSRLIDYAELDEFNKWVDRNLEYAVKNTQATAEALKEEAQQNNGTVSYSEQAIKDGIEGVKYWQSAVLFLDKTLKNEKYELADQEAS